MGFWRQWGLSIISVFLLLFLTPSYMTLAHASDELGYLRAQLEAMNCTVTVTWANPPPESTTYYGVSSYYVSENGTITLTGHKDSLDNQEGEYVIGHAAYTEVEKICNE